MAAVTDENPTVRWREARDLVQDSYSSFSPVLGDARRPLPRRALDRRAGAARQARRARSAPTRVPSRAPVRDAQLHLAPPRRADARARARPRRARRARRPAGHLPHGDAADAGRDRERVRRDDRLRPPARAGRDAGVAAVAAGRVDRGLDRHRLPPDRHEPVRGPHPHRAPRERRARRSTASASCGRSRRRSCSATRSRSPRATAPGGPTCTTSSACRATSTRTPTGSCSRWRSTAATRRRATSFVPAYIDLLSAGGSKSPEELGEIVGIDLADPGFWDKGLDLVERQLDAAEQAARDAGRL